MGWAGRMCLTICFLLYSPNIRFRKDKFSRQHFKKISQILIVVLLFKNLHKNTYKTDKVTEKSAYIYRKN